jgi:Lrp/AsnC family transcriptional regulator, leucine-responsive regulatory protein
MPYMPKIQLDRIDQKILAALQKSGKLSNVELAKKVGLSPTPCLRRVNILEKAGVISGYGARISRSHVGLKLTAFVAVNIERHSDADAERFRKAVIAMPEVIACYITSGEHDFLLHVVMPSLEEYRDFTLERLIKVPGVKGVLSSFVIDTVKEDGLLPLNHLA